MPTPHYLGQAVAIEASTRKSTLRELTDAHHALQKPAMIEGLERTYRKRFDDDADLPSEGTRVQVTVHEMIAATRASLARLFDVTAARDYTNGPNGPTDAVADVVVDGVALIGAAPVPYLLWLEKQLESLLTFARKLPTHDPSTEWEEEDPRGVYRSTPIVTARQVQEPKIIVAVQATKEHPAQVAHTTENVVKGWWTQTRLTGAIPIAERAALVRRVEALQRAVHVAREQANRAEAIEPRIGDTVMQYLFG